MIRVIRICRKCGAKIFSDAPEGLCAKCVLKIALTIPLEASVAAGDDGGSVENVGPNAATAPRSKKAERVVELLGELGDYELLEEIGRGGQGVVFRARQKSLNRTVALKVIGLGQWASKAHLKRFRREAEAAASLEHPGIVPIHEVGERDGSCYFSMKLIEGGQLDEIVRRQPMPIRQAAEMIANVARTVHYAHEHGILHRDIKPGNILLDAKGEPHLTDFGLARLLESEATVTRTLEVLGTPSYMAPEQALGENAAVSSATDVYGLGAVLYQLLTGQPPFAGGTTYETIKLVLDSEPRQPRLLNPKIDRDLSTICLKCLEKDPKHRYPSALALAEDLERWLKHKPILARRIGGFSRGRKWVRRNPSMAAMMALLLALAVPLGVLIWKTETQQLSLSNLAAPEKSIAVLPFSNLSKEPDNAFFVDGVQDEILTDLARIADLKVISRTSVMHYKSDTARNLREIGQQLGVAHVLEGSVQRAGNRVRVNAQLVDARTDQHLWAQTYDRDVADVFAIQSEIAKAIADQLQAKLSPNERAAIERPPTTDLTAFDLYSHARTLLLSAGLAIAPQQQFPEAIDLLNQAVGRDPNFFPAYCELAKAHDQIYFLNIDHTAARLGLAEAAVQTALHLRPDAGEAHLALAGHLYWGYLDYDHARAEIVIAERALPNDPAISGMTATIDRRQGRWQEAMRNLERATKLDPRNVYLLRGIAGNYLVMRRYPEAASVLERALEIAPKEVDTRVSRAFVDFEWHADTRLLHTTIQSLRAENTVLPGQLTNQLLNLGLLERDLTECDQALAALSGNAFRLGISDAVVFNRAFCQGLIDRVRGDTAAARAAFTTARAQQEELLRMQPDYAPALCVLGLIDAGLGRKEEALREGRRAVELLPVTTDSINGAHMIEYFAVIATWCDEKDLALEQLARITRLPSQVGYGYLRLHPFWDPLRGDPRFEQLVEEAKQPVALK